MNGLLPKLRSEIPPSHQSHLEGTGGRECQYKLGLYKQKKNLKIQSLLKFCHFVVQKLILSFTQTEILVPQILNTAKKKQWWKIR